MARIVYGVIGEELFEWKGSQPQTAECGLGANTEQHDSQMGGRMGMISDGSFVKHEEGSGCEPEIGEHVGAEHGKGMT